VQTSQINLKKPNLKEQKINLFLTLAINNSITISAFYLLMKNIL
jgi:hypothetical protein